MKNGTQLVETIDFLLKIKKQSRNDFCKSINIPPSTVATWKTKNIFPTVDVLALIADNLGVSLDWLVNGENDEVFVIRRINKDYLNQCESICEKYRYEINKLESMSSDNRKIFRKLLEIIK